jgi:hypothetical protein
MAINPKVTWNASDSSGVTSYGVSWQRNGVAAGSPVTVPQSASGDASGYSSTWDAANPGVTLAGGDVLVATVVAVNGATNLSSAPATSNSLTIPTQNVPPDPPVNVVLSLT